MKRTTILAIHAGYWFFYEILLTVIFILVGTASPSGLKEWDDLIAILLMATITGLASFYTFYLWLVPSYLTAGRVATFISSGLAASIVVATLATIVFSLAITQIVYILVQQLDFFLFSLTDHLWLVTGFGLLALVNGILGMLVRGFITWFVTDKENKGLVTSKLQAELALLKAQINPHFLFNTLNNIDVLIAHDPEKASLYLNSLSDLLRYVLYESQADWVPLTRELEYIRKYIDLQKVRTVNKDFVVLEISNIPEEVVIPPMILIPYVENAFKYASSRNGAGAIHVSISCDGLGVRFHCSNNINKNTRPQSEASGGLGNKLVKQRLQLIYGDLYQLDVQNEGDRYAVNLNLPYKIHELPVD